MLQKAILALHADGTTPLLASRMQSVSIRHPQEIAAGHTTTPLFSASQETSLLTPSSSKT